MDWNSGRVPGLLLADSPGNGRSKQVRCLDGENSASVVPLDEFGGIAGPNHNRVSETNPPWLVEAFPGSCGFILLLTNRTVVCPLPCGDYCCQPVADRGNVLDFSQMEEVTKQGKTCSPLRAPFSDRQRPRRGVLRFGQHTVRVRDGLYPGCRQDYQFAGGADIGFWMSAL